MKIEVTRAFFLAGEPQPVGSLIDIADDRFARELIHNGKAKPAQEKPAEEAPAAPSRGRKSA